MPALQQMARRSDNLLARFHALWTLEGLGALDAALVREPMKDQNPRMRIQAIRASETLYKAGRQVVRRRLPRADEGSGPNVGDPGDAVGESLQADGRGRLVKAAQAANTAKGVALIGERLLAPAAPAFGGGRRGRPA